MAKMVAIRLFLGRTQLLKSINGFEGIFVPFEGGGCLIWHFNKIIEIILVGIYQNCKLMGTKPQKKRVLQPATAQNEDKYFNKMKIIQ